jgi:hypothetical protein
VYPTCLFQRGERDLARGDRPPRVVWVLGAETYEPPEKTSDNPRSLATAVATVTAHIWGRDRDSAKALRHNVHVAAYRAAWGSFEPVSTSAEELEQRVIEHGAVLQFEMRFRIPVPDQTVPEVLITGFSPDLTNATPGDGILQCGET